MARVAGVDVGGVVYHVLNRANFRSALFKKAAPYQAFLAAVAEFSLQNTMRNPARPGKGS